MSSIDAPALNGAKLQAKLINEKGGLLDKKIEIIGIAKTEEKRPMQDDWGVNCFQKSYAVGGKYTEKMVATDW